MWGTVSRTGKANLFFLIVGGISLLLCTLVWIRRMKKNIGYE
jgi:LPXTG-motif cell wall-anchored protein